MSQRLRMLHASLTFALEPLVSEPPHEVPAIVTPGVDSNVIVELWVRVGG